MSNLHETATKYVELGFSVFPVNSANKRPAIAEWKPYQDRQPTPEELKQWFVDEKHDGIAIVTGQVSGIVVVDVEAEGRDETIKAFGLKSGRVSNTRRGGKHFYYQWRGKVQNTVRFGGRQVDIRGDGGYVVAPPTPGWSWETGGDIKSMYLRPLPEKVQSALGIKKNGDNFWEEKLKEPLKISELSNLGVGSRNNSLLRIADSLLQKHTAEDAWELLRGLNNNYSPPLPEKELKTLFTQAYTFIGKQGKLAQSDKINDTISGEPRKWIELEHTGDTYEWVWEGMVAKGETTLFAAEPKKGKSTLLRHLFRAIGKGEEFAGRPTRKTKVLVISEEGQNNWAEYREGWKKEDIDQVYVWSRPLRARPKTVDAWINFIGTVSQKVQELEIGLLVIDTIANFWPVKKEAEEGQVLEALAPLYTFTEDMKIAVLIVHHNRKMEGSTIESVRGSNALTGWPAQIIGFKGAPAGTKTQRLMESVGRLDDEPFSVLLELTGDDNYKTLGDPLVVSKSFRIKRVIETMIDINAPVSVLGFWKNWLSANGEIGRRTMFNYFKELHKNGIIKEYEQKTLETGNRETVYVMSPNWSEKLISKYPYIIIDR